MFTAPENLSGDKKGDGVTFRLCLDELPDETRPGSGMSCSIVVRKS